MVDFDPEKPVEAEEPRVADAIPEADALEQQTDVVADDESAQPARAPIEPELEADPVDVDEQRRVVPLPDEE
jgi:hypothetical protein